MLVLSCNNKTKDEPSLVQPIIDNADLLTKTAEDSISQLIMDLENNVGSQIAIHTIETLDGENMNEHTIKILEKLKLGREQYEDGLLIFISEKDRSVRIEVGYGLEKIIKDEVAARIIREDLTPRFKKNEYGQGVYSAVVKIKKLIEDNQSLVGKKY